MLAVTLCSAGHSLAVWLACGVAFGAVIGAYAWAKSGRRVDILFALILAVVVAGGAVLHADEVIVPFNCKQCEAGQVPCLVCWVNWCSCGDGMSGGDAARLALYLATGLKL